MARIRCELALATQRVPDGHQGSSRVAIPHETGRDDRGQTTEEQHHQGRLERPQLDRAVLRDLDDTGRSARLDRRHEHPHGHPVDDVLGDPAVADHGPGHDGRPRVQWRGPDRPDHLGDGARYRSADDHPRLGRVLHHVHDAERGHRGHRRAVDAETEPALGDAEDVLADGGIGVVQLRQRREAPPRRVAERVGGTRLDRPRGEVRAADLEGRQPLPDERGPVGQLGHRFGAQLACYGEVEAATQDHQQHQGAAGAPCGKLPAGPAQERAILPGWRPTAGPSQA